MGRFEKLKLLLFQYVYGVVKIMCSVICLLYKKLFLSNITLACSICASIQKSMNIYLKHAVAARVLIVVGTLFYALLAVPVVSAAPSADCRATLTFAVTDVQGKAISKFEPSDIGPLNIILYTKIDFNDAAKCDASAWSGVTAFHGFDAIVNGSNQFLGNGDIKSVSATQYEVKLQITTSNLSDVKGGVPGPGSEIQLRGFINLRDAVGKDNFQYSPVNKLSVTGAPAGTPTPVVSGSPSVTPSVSGVPGGVVATIQNPIPFNSLGELIVAAIRFILTMLGAVTVFFIVWGSVKMVISQGNESAIKNAKATIQWAVIGLVVALTSFSVIALVQSFLRRQ